MNESSQSEFWDVRYSSGKTPWSSEEVPSQLNSFLRSTAPGTALIPGCGPGDAVRVFHEAGWHVTALDFSPVAVEQAQTRLGELGRCVLLGDFFRHDFGSARFDVCYERSFLCALPPDLWPDYADRMAQLLRPGGLLIGIFFYGHEPESPPYPLDDAQAQKLFGPKFSLRRSVPVQEPHPFYGDGERWLEWVLR